MVFVRWEAKAKVTSKQRPDVKINSTTVQISPEAVERFQIGSDTHVNLFWDGQRHMIGVHPVTPDDADAVPLKFNKRTSFATVKCKLFLSSLGLSEAKVSSGALRIVNGLLAFDVDLPTRSHYGFSASESSAPKRRGRRPKAQMVVV